MTTRVLSIQYSGLPSMTSLARLVTSLNALDEMTLCYRIKIMRFRLRGTLVSYAFSDEHSDEIRIGKCYTLKVEYF